MVSGTTMIIPNKADVHPVGSPDDYGVSRRRYDLDCVSLVLAFELALGEPVAKR